MSFRVLDLADPSLVADLRGRDLAISASAGSGKTFTLVTLVLGFLGLDGHRPHDVRAATFGKEAAADLRQRVLKPLDELAAWTVEEWRQSLAALEAGFEAWDGWIRAQDRRLEIAMAARQWMAQGRPAWMASPASARSHWTRARREAELLEISTVHSLATGVLRRHGLGARVLEAKDPALLRLLRQAGREALDREVPDEDRPAAAHLLAWAEGWQEGGDGWAKWAEGFDAHQDALGRWREDTDTEEVRGAFWREGGALADAYGPFAAEPVRAAKLYKGGKPHGSFKPGKFPPAFQGGPQGVELLAFLHGLSSALVDEEKGQTKNYTSEAFSELMSPLWTRLPALWEGWCTLLLERVFARFRALKRERGLRSYGDLVRDAIALLEESPEEGPALLLVDEYQDVNPGQEKLLGLLRAGATVVVGDPKQAIYRFRGGEAALLEAKLEAAGRGAFRLPANHRSAAPVVELANAFVSQVAPWMGCAGYDPGGLQEDGGRGEGEARVGFVAFPSEKRGSDLPGATDWIAGLSRDAGWPASGFASTARKEKRRALLLSRRRGLPALRRALQAQGLEPLVQGREGFWESPGVRLLLALLEAVGRPERPLPFAALLRSPWVGATDGELAGLKGEVAKGFGAFGSLPERLRGAAAWLRSLEGLDTQSLVARALSRPGLLELVEATAVHGALEPERARRNLDRFLDLVPALSRHPASAFSELDQLRRATDPGDAPAEGARADLVLQTVHASKGLEYEDVILPLLAQKAIDARSGSLGRVDGALVSAWKFGSAPGPAYEALRAQERSGRLRDALNQLYVGLTRAKDRLMLLVQGDAEGGLVHLEDGRAEHRVQWNHVGARIGDLAEGLGFLQPAAPPDLAPVIAVEPPPLDAPSHGALALPVEESIPAEAAELELRRRQGILVHALLREVLVRHAQDPAAAQAYLDASPSLKAFPAAKGMVEAFLAALEKRGWLHLPRRTELPLEGAAASGVTGFADLVLWEPDRARPAAIHVVDYKLAADFVPAQMEEYRHQLARYRDALQARHPGAAVTAQLFALGSNAWVGL